MYGILNNKIVNVLLFKIILFKTKPKYNFAPMLLYLQLRFSKTLWTKARRFLNEGSWGKTTLQHSPPLKNDSCAIL